MWKQATVWRRSEHNLSFMAVFYRNGRFSYEVLMSINYLNSLVVMPLMPGVFELLLENVLATFNSTSVLYFSQFIYLSWLPLVVVKEPWTKSILVEATKNVERTLTVLWCSLSTWGSAEKENPNTFCNPSKAVHMGMIACIKPWHPELYESLVRNRDCQSGKEGETIKESKLIQRIWQDLVGQILLLYGLSE